MAKKLLLLCCWLFFPQLSAATQLTLYAYHSSPPFVINAEAETGLNYDLVRALQQQLGDKYQLQYKYLPRPQLNARLQSGEPTIVLWANPAWFSNKVQPYSWTEEIFTDRDVFVSHREFAGDLTELNNLAGSTLGAIRGYSYPGVNELVEQRRVTRLDAESDKENLARLQERNVDHVVITRSSFLYYGRQQQYLGKFRIVGEPYPAYKRQLLLSQHYQNLLGAFDKAINELPKQEYWTARLELYGLKTQ
ncbi:substrate-binding periplasmic protein [Rheinheimera sp.]|uniref:substrate-binding periplasmic protein n=1 Tax=Rheinheimera sp. TaxID=1869214 RepID=UPI002FDEBAF6